MSPAGWYILLVYKGVDLIDIRFGTDQSLMNSAMDYPMADRLEMITLIPPQTRFFNRWTKQGGKWIAVSSYNFPGV